MTRKFITITISVDMDPVPGAFSQPDHFSNLMIRELQRVAHYNPEVVDVCSSGDLDDLTPSAIKALNTRMT